jgi:hypothetical protein
MRRRPLTALRCGSAGQSRLRSAAAVLVASPALGAVSPVLNRLPTVPSVVRARRIRGDRFGLGDQLEAVPIA